MTTQLLLCMVMGLLQADRHSQTAERLVEAINSDDQESIQKLFNPGMQEFMPLDKSSEFFRGILRQRGKITKVGKASRQGNSAFFLLTCERGEWELRLSLDRKDLISSLYIRPPKPMVPVPERNPMPLRLPFDEQWSVFWGGSTVEQNYHVNTPNQRRALDLVIRDEKGSSHSGSGQKNEDYYCYGKSILAPAVGTVITVIEGVPDNAPGSLNSYSAVGNCVIIRHADHIFSVLAHFQPGAIQVKVGDKVEPGTILGRCGNSGNSSEPHLHFHLQHEPVLQDGLGIAPYFENVQVTRDGKTTTEKDYTPLRGDRIQIAN